jgi:hypothetical protein
MKNRVLAWVSGGLVVALSSCSSSMSPCQQAAERITAACGASGFTPVLGVDRAGFDMACASKSGGACYDCVTMLLADPANCGRLGTCRDACSLPGGGDGGQPDGGQPDGGQPDGGQPDGGQPDGGQPDGGLPDGGLPDGGLPDGGLPDGGLPDGGGGDGGLVCSAAGPPGSQPGAQCDMNAQCDVGACNPDAGQISLAGGVMIAMHPGSMCGSSCDPQATSPCGS